jgi:methyl-accepting chemotaxis protein
MNELMDIINGLRGSLGNSSDEMSGAAITIARACERLGNQLESQTSAMVRLAEAMEEANLRVGNDPRWRVQ